MRLVLDLPTAVSIALRRFAAGTETSALEEAAALALREFLIGTGDLELVPSLDEDGDVAGNA